MKGATNMSYGTSLIMCLAKSIPVAEQSRGDGVKRTKKKERTEGRLKRRPQLWRNKCLWSSSSWLSGWRGVLMRTLVTSTSVWREETRYLCSALQVYKRHFNACRCCRGPGGTLPYKHTAAFSSQHDRKQRDFIFHVEEMFIIQNSQWLTQPQCPTAAPKCRFLDFSAA